MGKMVSNSEVQHLQTLWAQFIAVEEVRGARWIQPGTGQPCRQKPLASQLAIDRDQARVQLGGDGLWYYHSINGPINAIITTDQMCKHVMDAYDSTKMGRRQFEAWLVKEFVGTRTWDIRFLLNNIRDNRRAAVARSSTPEGLSYSQSPHPTQHDRDEIMEDDEDESIVVDSATSRLPGDEHSVPNNRRVQPSTQYNQAQKDIFGSAEVHYLLNAYLTTLKGTDDSTHHYRNAKEAVRILQTQRLGKAQTFKERADLFLTNSVKLVKHLQNGPGNKAVMIQDATQTEGNITTEQVFKDLRHAASKLGLRVDVADSGRMATEPIVTTISVEEAETRWKDQNTFPIQLLNLSPVFRSAPAYLRLQSGFPFLGEAIILANMFGELLEHYPEGSRDALENRTLASLTIDREIGNDTDSCAQAGTFRRWSIDPLAGFTLITVEGRSATASNQVENPLVLLSFLRMDNVSADKVTEIYTDFANDPANYEPPERFIRTVCLRKSDYLLLPPGTIYSLIVVKDAYLMESRVMSARFLSDHILYWRYITDFPQCINGNAPRQTRRIIHQIRKAILDDPQKYGYEEKEHLDNFVQSCGVISKDDLACECDAMLGCNELSGCGCVSIGLPCAASCHYGDGEKCGNPNGCCARDIE